jgi:hypothetical protein
MGFNCTGNCEIPTAQSRILLEKSTVSLFAWKFPNICGTRKCFTVFKKAGQCSDVHPETSTTASKTLCCVVLPRFRGKVMPTSSGSTPLHRTAVWLILISIFPSTPWAPEWAQASSLQLDSFYTPTIQTSVQCVHLLGCITKLAQFVTLAHKSQKLILTPPAMILVPFS